MRFLRMWRISAMVAYCQGDNLCYNVQTVMRNPKTFLPFNKLPATYQNYTAGCLMNFRLRVRAPRRIASNVFNSYSKSSYQLLLQSENIKRVVCQLNN